MTETHEQRALQRECEAFDDGACPVLEFAGVGELVLELGDVGVEVGVGSGNAFGTLGRGVDTAAIIERATPKV